MGVFPEGRGAGPLRPSYISGVPTLDDAIRIASEVIEENRLFIENVTLESHWPTFPLDHFDRFGLMSTGNLSF